MTQISADSSAAQQPKPADPAADPLLAWEAPKRKRGRPKKSEISENHLSNAERHQRKLTREQEFVKRVTPAAIKYCVAIANGARAREAVAIAKVPYSDISKALWYSPYLKQLLSEAIAERDRKRSEELHDEVFHRAVNGHPEPMVSAGRKVCNRTVRSDRLLELLYKCEHPEIFIHKIEGNVNVTARTITDIVAELENKTPIGTNKPTVYLNPAPEKPGDKTIPERVLDAVLEDLPPEPPPPPPGDED